MGGIFAADFFILFVSLFFLGFFSDIAIENAVRFAKLSGMGKLAVGFLLVSLITSLPEFAITLSSVVERVPKISLGNLVGADVANITLILGVVSLLAPMRFKKEHEFQLRFPPFLIIPPLLLLLLNLSPSSHFLVGVCLITFFFFVAGLIMKRGITLEERKPFFQHKREYFNSLVAMLLSLSLVLLCAHLIVNRTVKIARAVGISSSLIAATLLSLGTTLPELSTSLSAVRKGHPSVALGNVLGSCIVNLSLILGILLVLSAPQLPQEEFTTLLLFAISLPLILYVLLQDYALDRKDGAVLFVTYTIFLVILLPAPNFLRQFF